MRAKILILLAAIILLMSSCSREKTIPVITEGSGKAEEAIEESEEKPAGTEERITGGVIGAAENAMREGKESIAGEGAVGENTADKESEEEDSEEEKGKEGDKEGDKETMVSGGISRKEPNEMNNPKDDVLAPSETRTIIIKDLKLNPQKLAIRKGDMVVWRHEDEWERDDETKHYLAAHSNEFRTPILYYGDEFNHVFNRSGTFTYFDVLYKEKADMRGEVIVG